MSLSPNRNALLWGALSAFLFAGWQQITVACNFEGNWTALFCTGSKQPVPPALDRGTYRVNNPNGFDGQMYRYVAHDPFLNRDEHKYLDSPPLRARRILVPALAWLLALGRQEWIDWTYIFLFWAIGFAGTYWLALYLALHDRPRWMSLIFLAIPSTLIATDRLVIDMAACALMIGLILYSLRKDRRMVFLLLLLGCLCRETGFLPVAAFALAAMLSRQWRRAALLASSTLPAVAWYGYVQVKSGSAEIPEWVGKTSEIGPLKWLLHPFPYTFAAPMALLAQVLDSAAILGMIAAFGLAFVFGAKHFKRPVPLTALLFATSSVATIDPFFWNQVYNFSRPYSPMLAILALHGLVVPRRAWVWLTPIVLMDLRILFQLSPQVLGVFGIKVAT